MPLTGQAKTDYQREDMRKYRSNAKIESVRPEPLDPVRPKLQQIRQQGSTDEPVVVEPEPRRITGSEERAFESLGRLADTADCQPLTKEQQVSDRGVLALATGGWLGPVTFERHTSTKGFNR